MLHRIISARYLRDYTVRLRFSDGTEGDVDLATELNGPLFEPLRERKLFSQMRLHPDIHTLVWPNGADLAPEFLRQRLRSVVQSAATD